MGATMPAVHIIDHTGDIGIAWEAANLPALFATGAEAFASLLVENPAGPGTDRSRPIEIDAVDLPDLLVRFLQEFLFLFETEREVYASVKVSDVSDGGEGGRARLTARAHGRAFDAENEDVKLLVKAVTYHTLDVSPTETGGWRARVIFDV
jgi:SHS2 domain-containing protein